MPADRLGAQVRAGRPARYAGVRRAGTTRCHAQAPDRVPAPRARAPGPVVGMSARTRVSASVADPHCRWTIVPSALRPTFASSLAPPTCGPPTSPVSLTTWPPLARPCGLPSWSTSYSILPIQRMYSDHAQAHRPPCPPCRCANRIRQRSCRDRGHFLYPRSLPILDEEVRVMGLARVDGPVGWARA